MRPINKSLKEYGRGLVGGLLFSLPLLFTMEVWWAGHNVDYRLLIIYIFFTFLLLIAYNRYAGMREDATFREVLVDSVEEMGLGLLFSTAILWLIGRIDFMQMPAEEVIGKITIEAMMVAIGISVGTAQLGAEKEEDKNDKGMADDKKEKDAEPSLLNLAALSVCGGVLVGGNVAPTEEIVMIALEITAFQALLLALLSLAISAVILFFSDFKGTPSSASGRGSLKVLFSTSFIYAIALATSVIILWFFGRFEGNGFEDSIFEMIVLGVPTTLGASAGRLLIK